MLFFVHFRPIRLGRCEMKKSNDGHRPLRARAASGQEAIALPNKLMNSRRLIAPPEASRTEHRNDQDQPAKEAIVTGKQTDELSVRSHVHFTLKADIGCVLDYRSVGDAAVTPTPVYARDTDWSSRIALLQRMPMLAFS